MSNATMAQMRKLFGTADKRNTNPPHTWTGRNVWGDPVTFPTTVTVDVGNASTLTGVINSGVINTTVDNKVWQTAYSGTTTHIDVGSIGATSLSPPALRFTDSRGNVVGELNVDEVNCRLVFEGDANEAALRLFSLLAERCGMKLKHVAPLSENQKNNNPTDPTDPTDPDAAGFHGIKVPVMRRPLPPLVGLVPDLIDQPSTAPNENDDISFDQPL